MPDNTGHFDRREFLKTTAAGLGAAAAAGSLGSVQAAESTEVPKPPEVDPKKLIWRSRSANMEYARLGRTNFMASRIVSGLGGAAGNPEMWRRQVSQGVNYFDTARGYGNSEINLKEYLKDARDEVWITSKASDIAGYTRIDPDVQKLYLAEMKNFLSDAEFSKLTNESQAKEADNPRRKGRVDLLAYHHAAVEKQKATGEKPDIRVVGKKIADLYLSILDESLERMGTDHVDAYFVHGVEIPWMYQCIELWEAFEKAQKAGKVKHFGISVHNHHKEVLVATAEADTKGPWKIDLIMPGVNPVSFDDLRPELEALKKRDIGIIAMKTSGLKNRKVDGNDKRFGELMESRKFNEFERSKLFMLNLTDNLIDAVVCGMKNMEEMEKDIPLATVKLSGRALQELRTIVKLEMAGACHLCGNCQSNCPEHIAVVDMIRYHAYVHQYEEKEMARELYQLAGYNPAEVCNHCGKCADVCASGVPIVNLLHELAHDMA